MTDYFRAGTFNTGKHNLSWHKKEENTPPIVDGDSVTDAMSKANILDIEVGKYDTFVHVGSQQISTGDKKQLALTNCPWETDQENGIQLLHRTVDWYEPIQNKQYAEILDPLSKQYPTAGVLMAGRYGEVLVVQLEMPEYEIGGNEQELHKPFLLVSEDRKSGLKIFGSVHTRVVCMNTYNAALGEDGDKSLPNTMDSYAVLTFRTRIEEKAIESQQRYINGMNHLFKAKATNDDIDELKETLFPEPRKPQMLKLWENNQDVLNGDNISQTVDKRGQRAANLFQNAIDRNERYGRELVENFFRFNDEHNYAAWTKYGLWQATTEFFNHSDEWQSEQDIHSYNLLFGDKAKQMAAAWQVLTK